MLVVIVSMILILALAGLVVAYVAYPHRGEELPAAPWLGDAMSRAAEAAPLIEQEYANDHETDHQTQDAEQRR